MNYIYYFLPALSCVALALLLVTIDQIVRAVNKRSKA